MLPVPINQVLPGMPGPFTEQSILPNIEFDCPGDVAQYKSMIILHTLNKLHQTREMNAPRLFTYNMCVANNFQNRFVQEVLSYVTDLCLITFRSQNHRTFYEILLQTVDKAVSHVSALMTVRYPSTATYLPESVKNTVRAILSEMQSDVSRMFQILPNYRPRFEGFENKGEMMQQQWPNQQPMPQSTWPQPQTPMMMQPPMQQTWPPQQQQAWPQQSTWPQPQAPMMMQPPMAPQYQNVYDPYTGRYVAVQVAPQGFQNPAFVDPRANPNFNQGLMQSNMGFQNQVRSPEDSLPPIGMQDESFGRRTSRYADTCYQNLQRKQQPQFQPEPQPQFQHPQFQPQPQPAYHHQPPEQKTHVWDPYTPVQNNQPSTDAGHQHMVAAVDKVQEELKDDPTTWQDAKPSSYFKTVQKPFPEEREPLDVQPEASEPSAQPPKATFSRKNWKPTIRQPFLTWYNAKCSREHFIQCDTGEIIQVIEFFSESKDDEDGKTMDRSKHFVGYVQQARDRRAKAIEESINKEIDLFNNPPEKHEKSEDAKDPESEQTYDLDTQNIIGIDTNLISAVQSCKEKQEASEKEALLHFASIYQPLYGVDNLQSEIAPFTTCDEFHQIIAHMTDLMKKSDETVKELKEHAVDQYGVMFDSINRFLTKRVNDFLKNTLGLKIDIDSFYEDVLDLPDFLRKNYGAIYRTGLRRFETKLCNDLFDVNSTELLDAAKSIFKSNSEDVQVRTFLPENVAVLTLKASSNEIFTESDLKQIQNGPIQITSKHFAKLYAFCKIIFNRSNAAPLTINRVYMTTFDGLLFELSESVLSDVGDHVYLVSYATADINRGV